MKYLNILFSKNRPVVLFFIFLSFSFVIGAKSLSPIMNVLNDIGDDMYYDFTSSKNKLDSLKQSFSKDDKLIYSPYLVCFDAFIAYRESQYADVLTLADSALESFLWERSPEWEARCLITLAFTAEALTLDQDALDYYNAVSSLTNNDDVISFLALMGQARSQKRLGQDFSTSLNAALQCQKAIGKLELELLYRRDYFWFYPHGTSILLDLNSLVDDYLELKMWTNAATVYKLIAQYYVELFDFQKARLFMEKAFHVIEFEDDVRSIYLASLKLSYSLVLFNLEAYEPAKVQLDESIYIYEGLGQSQSNYYAYLWHSDIARAQNNFKDADIYARKAMLCQKKMTQIKKSTNSFLVEVLINRKHIENKLSTHRKKQVIQLTLLVILSISVVLVLIFVNKKNEKEIGDNLAVLKKDNTVLSKEKIELLNIVKKLEKESTLSEGSDEFEKRIKRDLEMNKNLAPDFCQLYQKNISQFSGKHTVLTPSEIRTAVMIAMDIPSKSIVKLLCIEPETLKTYRKRIRKKLKLTPDDELSQYLKSFLYELSN